jgi:hypothetical protein
VRGAGTTLPGPAEEPGTAAARDRAGHAGAPRDRAGDVNAPRDRAGHAGAARDCAADAGAMRDRAVTARRVRAALRKELLEARRGCAWQAPAMAAAGVGMEVLAARSCRGVPAAAAPLVGPILAASLTLTVPALLLAFGSAVLSRAFVEERARRTLPPLLATGASPAVLWGAKVAVAFGAGWAVAVATWALNAAWLSAVYGGAIPIGPGALAAALVLAPLASAGPLAFSGMLFWAWPRAGFVASFIPVLFGITLWSRLATDPVSLPAASACAAALGASAATVAVSAFVVTRLPRGRIAGATG